MNQNLHNRSCTKKKPSKHLKNKENALFHGEIDDANIRACEEEHESCTQCPLLIAHEQNIDESRDASTRYDKGGNSFSSTPRYGIDQNKLELY